ncbi:SHOCT domain-containing protein [Desulfosporosinus lacus]|uniref:Putative membrane protein n=1 Tax=Desulfosporosinus lacus DSM 15449 TaxID=1121420 RepID=A0A1M5ZHQ9_9FIRM|nr:SHOCT domain-containing protein [Desulfosporosinus lacus]SHI23837.1 putative membrane protein [Desulfosporosinus lacus DSM 15449]
MMIGLILLAVIAYYMFSPSSSGASCCMGHQSQANTPLDILNERYARGEIQRDEYLERKRELSGQKRYVSIKKE